MRQILVIGGGASGLFAAICAADRNAFVTILEHKDRVGKKILSTGNGRCNYTNAFLDSSCYYSNEFAMEVIGKFSVEKTLEYFKELGIWPKSRGGYYYPSSDQASAVLDVLRDGLEKRKVLVKTEVTVNFMDFKKGKFRVHTNIGNFKADAVILACGGCTAPNTGSDGSGYELVKSFGHRIHKPVPALTAMRCEEKFFKQLAGVRTQAKIKLDTGKEVVWEEGEVQLTDYGVSGIPAFQLSRYMARSKKGQLEIDFMPNLSMEELVDYLSTHTKEQYVGMINKKLLAVLIKRYGEAPKELANGIKHFTTIAIGVNDFTKAQVTSGGVYCDEIDASTMESKFMPGLYLVGELVDVDGKCGGYNLQWAWSSAYVAASAASKE